MTKPLSRTDEELAHVAHVVAQVEAALRTAKAARPAATAQVGALPSRLSQPMARTELTEAYRRAGVRGPYVPAEAASAGRRHDP